MTKTNKQTYSYAVTEYISVVINGVPTEVPSGAIEVKSMFGDDMVLVHSSGLPLPSNEFGILLHPGETYFLVYSYIHFTTIYLSLSSSILINTYYICCFRYRDPHFNSSLPPIKVCHRIYLFLFSAFVIYTVISIYHSQPLRISSIVLLHLCDYHQTAIYSIIICVSVVLFVCLQLINQLCFESILVYVN